MKTIVEIKGVFLPDIKVVQNILDDEFPNADITVRELPAQPGQKEVIKNVLKYLQNAPDTVVERENVIALCKNLLNQSVRELPTQAPVSKEKLNQFADFIKRFANWSERWPREIIYNTSNRKMDDELIELEEEAHKIIHNWHPKSPEQIGVVPVRKEDDKNLCAVKTKGEP